MSFWKRLFAAAEEPEEVPMATHCKETDVVIRPYSKADAKSVMKLWADHFFVEVHRRVPNYRDVAVVTGHLDGGEPSTIWVATYQGQVVGFLGLTPPETNEGDAPIHVIAVHCALRGKRVASRLFLTALDALRRNPATSWISISDMSNGSCISGMARRAGFQLLQRDNMFSACMVALIRGRSPNGYATRQRS